MIHSENYVSNIKIKTTYNLKWRSRLENPLRRMLRITIYNPWSDRWTNHFSNNKGCSYNVYCYVSSVSWNRVVPYFSLWLAAPLSSVYRAPDCSRWKHFYEQLIETALHSWKKGSKTWKGMLRVFAALYGFLS